MALFDRKNNPHYQAKVIDEFFDTKKIVLMCQDHMYVGGGPIPEKGQHCKKCHLAFWQVLAASFPPEKRDEMIATMHEAAFKLVEALEKNGGTLGINLYKNPKIEIEKDAST